MIQDANAGIERILSSDRVRKQHVSIIVGMIDATPGLTCFRIYIGKKNVFDFEASTTALAVQPQLIEKRLIEEIDERRK